MTDWLQRARDLAPVVEKFREESERERRLPDAVFEAMREAGLWSFVAPRHFGGDAEPLGMLALVLEELARHDGAMAWNLCILNGNNMLAEYLPDAGAQEVFGTTPGYIAGSFAPKGVATRVEGGYRVKGQWPFASGSAQANWFMATCPVPEAAPIVVVAPRSEVQVLDTWYTAGLRGTGSNDIVLDDVFVPDARVAPLPKLAAGPGEKALHPRPFQDYGGPLLASIALGIARDAIESFKELAPGKTPLRSPAVLSQRHTAQQKLGQAEGLLQAARLHLREVWARLDGDEPNSPELTNTARLAATFAVESACKATALVYELGGGSSIYETSRLERCWRDVHTISHHALVSPNEYEVRGAFLLSAPLPDGPPEPQLDVWLTKVRELAPIVQRYRDESERERHLSTPVFEAMRERRLFSMLVSKAFGGSQVPLETAVRAVEQMSQYDGAAGWNLVIGAGGALMAQYLPEEHVASTFGDWAVAGSFGANGKAVPVEGGYRVTGRWSFGSGCHNATMLAAGCLVIEEGAPRMLPNGAPDIQIMLMPASECRIIDTWMSAGLRGTGSHDFEANDVFVPLGRHVSFAGMREQAPKWASRAYETSFFAMQGPLLAGVALGIARDAIESFRQLATEKTPRGGSMTLARQPTVHEAIARAEVLLRSSRAFVYEAARMSDALKDATPEQATEVAATMRLAGVHATAAASQAVDLVYDWAGTSSVYASSRIERCFRDVHVVSHHISIATVGFEMVGQYMLGGPFAQRR